MEITFERTGREMNCTYMQDIHDREPFIIKESGGMDYGSAVVLLQNLGERRDTTSLERDALSAAIRLLKHNTGTEKSRQ